VTTPQTFLASFLREKAALFAEVNVHLAPLHMKYFGQPLVHHSEDFLLHDKAQEVFEDVIASDSSATIITLDRFRTAEIRMRYRLAAAGDTWKIVGIDRECFYCRRTGKSEGVPCFMCAGEGWIDPRRESTGENNG
jgi:hypothetical protein